METHSNTLNSKELGDGDEIKKMTNTAPNTTDLNNVNHRQPFLPTGGESQAAKDGSGPQDELNKAADMTSIIAKTSALMGKKWKATHQATIDKTRNPGGRNW